MSIFFFREGYASSPIVALISLAFIACRTSVDRYSKPFSKCFYNNYNRLVRGGSTESMGMVIAGKDS